MIIAYHRPQTLDEALTLLTQPNTLPLGGGTLLASRKPTADSVQVVDLQLLGLDSLTKKGNELELGATLTLQSLLESEHCPEALKTALKLEACDGRSTFGTVLMALDAKITIFSDQSSVIGIGEFLPLRPRGLITSITVPMNVEVAFEYVSRTPADKPIVCVALTRWNSGRTRLAVGGHGKSPMLAMDGTEAEGVETAAKNAFHEATDEWASAEFRMDAAATLAKRCLKKQ
jgi:putative selenate reductase FAD-binding subunit